MGHSSDGHKHNQAPGQQTEAPSRLVGETLYVLFFTGPWVVAEGIRARLEAKRIPVFLENPFTPFSVGDFYMGTYTGDISLWIPQSLLAEAELVVSREHLADQPEAEDQT